MENTELFLEVLTKSKDPKEILEKFVLYCWDFEPDATAAFESMKEYCHTLSLTQKKQLIPSLIFNSQTYPNLVLLAEELFNPLSKADKESISVPSISWTMDDEYTYITDEEYVWRQRNKCPCEMHDGCHTRPAKALDIMCFEKVIRMMSESKSSMIGLMGSFCD